MGETPQVGKGDPSPPAGTLGPAGPVDALESGLAAGVRALLASGFGAGVERGQ